MNISLPSLTLGILTTLALSTNAAASELVVNGDFSNGNVGFTSGYNFTNPMHYNPGNYGIGANGASFGDHTTGNGNYMTVDGAFAANPSLVVWQEVISVTPNTDYLFGAWARAIGGGPTISLDFKANGLGIGALSLTNAPNDSWQLFNAIWNSGSNTSVTFNIVDLQTNNSVPGNDFALDDISFTNAAAVPLPASMWLFSFGLAGLGLLRKPCCFSNQA